MGSFNPENDAKQELNDSGCVQDAPLTECYKGQAQLLDLSDDVLLYILKLCTPMDLKALGHTCPRLGLLVCDRTLWQRVDARDTPIGRERLEWFLTHCLTPSTQELQLTGFVNRDSRCLGIQELTWSEGEASQGEVEHYLLRMWYPHLPRYAMSPRWPDKREIAFKSYTSSQDFKTKLPLGPLSQLASQIVSSTPNITTPPKNTDANTNTTATSEAGSLDPKEARRLEIQRLAAKCAGPQFTVDERLLKMLRVKCANLTSMSLDYCNLDYKNTNLKYLPPKLKRLSLRGTRCYNLPLNMSFLGKIQELLPELQFLDISECEWLEPASLMTLSKLPRLRELFMSRCVRLTECVAYASLATRYGFQQLKILDLRGSPVADSEVSAFGWLPLLEELYVSPPYENSTHLEHSHKWEDQLAPFCELEEWEMEVPDYYKCKTPPPEEMDVEEEEEKTETHHNARLGDVMLGNYVTCSSLEGRIIVISQNNENRRPHCNLIPEVLRAHGFRPPEANPGPAQPTPDPAPGPSKRRHSESAQDEVKRPRMNRETSTPEENDTNSIDEETANPGTSNSTKATPDPSNSTTAAPRSPHSTTPTPCSSNSTTPTPCSSNSTTPTPDSSNSTTAAPGPSNSTTATPGPSNSTTATPGSSNSTTATPGPSNSTTATPGPSNSTTATPGLSNSTTATPGPSNSTTATPGSSNSTTATPGPSNSPTAAPRSSPSTTPTPGSSNSTKPTADASNSTTATPGSSNSTTANARSNEETPGPSRRPVPRRSDRQHHRHRRDVANDLYGGYFADLLAQGLPNPGNFMHNLVPGVPPEIPMIPGPVYRHQRLRSGHDRLVGPIQNPPVDIRQQVYRQGIFQPMMMNLGLENIPSHNLVSDSAVLRFGRAENENVNYVHIGQANNQNPDNVGNRPDQSSLRILSIVGFHNITDRSLQHLATAAPHLRHVDFRHTNVTDQGVALFKAIRPNCEVIYGRDGPNCPE